MGFAEHYLAGMMQSSAEVLGRHGYEHVKAEELARSVGMSVGSLYRRYGSKQHFARTGCGPSTRTPSAGRWTGPSSASTGRTASPSARPSSPSGMR
ncbi:helix-turn-helix domain-containing protein [Pyxidicoccus caerfyrddinensis]|uniref:helix-turn-helix domain-containing protein n=1 Tax=Pyxidicoccus caerfyrddinensis TaxID=2709663 RepID=UPI0013DB348F